MDEVPQRRPGPPRSSSCPAKLPPIWGVLWAFFLLLQPPRRPRLRRRSWGPPPWCGSAAAELSETEPGLEKATQEAKAMAIATSVSPPGKGGCGLLASTVCPALLSLLFLLSLCVSLGPFSSGRLCLSPFPPPPPPNPLLFPFLPLTPHPQLLLGLGSPLSPPPPHSPLFFLVAASEWRGGGKSSPSPICCFMGGNRWPPVVAGAGDWEASKRLGGG